MFDKEKLKFNSEENGSKVKVFSLRIPDVLGPFDDSYRMQKYVTWMQMLIDGKPFSKLGYEAKDLDFRSSFVFSKDVAKVILDVSFTNQDVDGVFNLACAEQPNLPELLDFITTEVITQLKADKL